MASSKSYLDFIVDQLSSLAGIACRRMMGEYVLYYKDRVFGGIYDDRLLVKDVPAAAEKMPHAPRELPYPGAKPMLLVENVDNRLFLRELVEAMWPQLKSPAKKGGDNRG